MNSSQLLDIIKSFNIPADSADIVRLHLINRGIHTEEEALDRGKEITQICHIAEIINAVRIGAIADLEDDLVSGFRKLMLDEADRFFIPYDFIAFYIFKDPCKYEPNMVEEAYEDIISTSNHAFFEGRDENPVEEDLKNNIEKVFKKIQRHILLAIHQKQYILDNIDQAKEDVSQLQSNIKSLNKSADDLGVQAELLKNQADNTSKRLQHATGNYVAILGIFATIIFAVVGGINLFESAAKYIKLKNEFVLYVSTGVLALSLIIYFLFTWVDKLSGGDKPVLPKSPTKWDKAEYGIKQYGFFIFIILLLIIAGIALFTKSLTREVPNPPYKWVMDTPLKGIDGNNRIKAIPITAIRIEDKE